MLTTVLNSLTPGADPASGEPLKLLPEGATEPVATFANELKLRGAFPLTPPASGEWMAEPLEANRLLPAGEGLPEGGNALPEELREIVRQLRELAFTGDDTDLAAVTGSMPDTQVPQPLSEAPGTLLESVPEVELPPGLSFLSEKLADASPAEARQVLAQVLNGQIRPAGPAATELAPRTNLTASDATPAPNPLQGLTPESARAALDQIARIARVPMERVDAALEQRDLSAADLKRMLDSIKERLRAVSEALPPAATNAATASQPVPAATVRIDGQLMDGKLQRFRTLGVGQPGASVGTEPGLSTANVAGDRTTSAAQPRGDILIAETLRQESLRVKSQRLEALAQASGTTSTNVSQPTSVTQASPLNPGTAATQFAPDSGGLRTLNESIATPVRDPAWGERLGERVVMMANNKLQSIDIRLSPADLGPLRVKVSMEDGTASVSFVAQHGITRDAIEQALPRLKAQLEESGIDLGNTSVDQQAPEQHAAGSGGDEGRAAGDDDGMPDGQRDGGVDATPLQTDQRPGSAADGPERISRGLLDTFV